MGEEKRYYYWELQLIKYSKGHYGSSLCNERLFHFSSNLYGYYVRDADMGSLFHMIIDLHQKLVEDGRIKRFNLKVFLGDLFRQSWMYEHGSGKVGMWQVIQSLMSDIALMELSDMEGLEFGEIDEELSYILNY